MSHGSTVRGHLNCIKQIWGMEPIWLMDMGYDIVLESSATHRPSNATATQTSTNHYSSIMEHSWSDPGWRDGREKKKKTVLWIMIMVTLVIYHHPWEVVLDIGVSAEGWQISAPSSGFNPIVTLLVSLCVCHHNCLVSKKLIHVAVTQTCFLN